MKNNPLVVLGIDAADFEIITSLASKGQLKTFQNIISKGVVGPLHSTIPPFTAPSWTSFFTGTRPETHGIYDFVKKEGYTTTLYTLKDLRVPALWDFLEHVCILNVPMTYPAPHVDGFFVSGFPFSGDAAKAFWPPELKSIIEDMFGEYPLHEGVITDKPAGRKTDKNKDTPSTESHFKDLVSIMEKRKELYKYLLTEHDFDVYILEFQNTDTVQHRFWCFSDDRYIGFEPHKTLYNVIERLYQHMDKMVGELLACVPDSTVLIVSDHGFGLIDMVPALNNWLLKRGFLKTKTRQSTIGMYKRDLLSIFKTLHLHRVIHGIPGLTRALKKTLKTWRLEAGDAINWSDTAAYSLGYPLYIYINKKVVPTEEYESVREKIVNALKKDIPLEKVFTRKELYTHIDSETPDIIVKLTEYPLGEGKNIMGIAGHREKGIFAAVGPGIKKGSAITAHMSDIAPTILHICGQPIPSYMEGHVLPIFEEGTEPATREIKYTDTDKEKEKLREKIKTLKNKGTLKL
ncbi:MAG: alkaline phosphatase family protein [Candidatus Methanofastidiosia archaeon]|jgi:predicted AlkP superfamily phosphohydrolase/phosphomutase